MATPTRTYLSSTGGMKLAVPPHTVLPYLGVPPPPTSRFFGDPGVGNMYLGTSSIVSGREAYMGQRFGSERKYWNNGTAGDGWNASITWIKNSLNAGRVPWGSYKFNSPSLSWTQVAAGSADAWLVTMLNSIVSQTGGKGPVFMTFHHEPNGDGTASQYLAMERHLQTITDDYPSIVHVGGVLSAGYYQMSGGGGYNVSDWMAPDSCDVFGLDIYNPWSPANGKAWNSVDQAFRLGGIAECLALDPSKAIALGELGCRTRPTSGQSAQWMQDGYDYCRSANVVCMEWFDSGVNSAFGPWLLDTDYQGNIESPAPRLIKYKELLLKPTSKLIPLGGLAA